jgi:uncharacterized protein
LKYLVLLLIVLLGLWWIRQQRSGTNAPFKNKPQGAHTMLPCAQCGVHIPESEAVLGKSSPSGAPTVYCSPQHRRLHEGNV